MKKSWGRIFASLSLNRAYRTLFITLTISQIGTYIQDIAQIWFILEYTHSTKSLGIITACLYGPYTLLGLFSGAVINNLQPRRTMLFCQFLSMACALIMSTLFFLKIIDDKIIYSFALLRGFIMVINNPIRQLVIRQSVNQESLSNAIALNSSIFNMAKIIGPIIGGYLLANYGYGLCFLLNGFSFLIVIIGLLFLKPINNVKVLKKIRLQDLYLNTINSVKYINSNINLKLCFLLLITISVLCINFSVSLPILAKEVLNPSPIKFGYITATFSIGALVGSLISAYLGNSTLRRISIAGVAFGSTLIILSVFTKNFLLVLSILFILGCFYTLYTTFTNSYIHLTIEQSLQANIITLYSYVITGTNSIGALIIGFLANLGGSTVVFLIPGSIAIVVSLYILLKLYLIKVGNNLRFL